MLHRRCRYDDGYGADEALTENDRVKIKIWGMVGTKANSVDIMRKMSLLLNHPTDQFFATFSGQYSGLTSIIIDYNRFICFKETVTK